MDREMKEIRLDDMVPFRCHSGRTYTGERLAQLMDSIKDIGLLNPVIVRPIGDGKYEIICGHNRVKALQALGHATTKADVCHGLSGDMAQELFYDSNLNQQSFVDWSYQQKLEAVRYIEKQIRKDSRQGRRTDLEKATDSNPKDRTCVQSRQKSGRGSKETTRDRMARRLGISTATLSKYRRIVKLPDDLMHSIASLLDEKRITFEAAYIISNMRDIDIKWLIEGINTCPDKELDLNKLKELPHRNAKESNKEIYPISKEMVLSALIRPSASKTITPIRIPNK